MGAQDLGCRVEQEGNGADEESSMNGRKHVKVVREISSKQIR